MFIEQHSTDWTYIFCGGLIYYFEYMRALIFSGKDGKQVRRDATEWDDPVEAVEHSDNLQRVAWSMVAQQGIDM